MANPVAVTLVVDTWTKVATNVTTGVIERKDGFNDKSLIILETYKLTGEAAPANDDTAVWWTSNPLTISSSAAIDVYLKANRAVDVVVSL